MKHVHHSLVLACLAVVLPAPAICQEKPLVSVPFAGTEAFGHILHSFNFKPISKIEEAPPEKTLLIVFGNLGVLRQMDLDKFREAGGAVLLASDYQADVPQLPFEFKIMGPKVVAGETSAYKGVLLCPVISAEPRLGHPVMWEQRKGLATNSPTFFECSLRPVPDLLMKFPTTCSQESGNPLPQASGYLAGSGKDAAPGGRFLVLAGQGVFLNGMLIQTDNGNFSFAWNAIQWLSEGPHGRREYALFIDEVKGESRVIDQFALPLSKFGGLPMPPLQVINQMLRGLEDENVFNRLLLEITDKEVILRRLAPGGIHRGTRAHFLAALARRFPAGTSCPAARGQARSSSLGCAGLLAAAGGAAAPGQLLGARPGFGAPVFSRSCRRHRAALG